ncbi:hypothetical protein EPUS_03668 [Endocarpon pusillum Z07020]|uniref:Uncharacterized protein n=1 Tax=Endocarpon pusillum (strain Z07020 / HMAS-L-300199) TaxID=1263415 RepID=U1GDA8_ENDPU|nr:uncharacterized protein EPUS_03668 [Endocarpon pusillum Z07020]ERF69676.1 hypothetical protein EPUS_03668 [Endocarpon pusillum Z07020]
MDYGLDGNMRINVAESQLQIDSVTVATENTDFDDSQIGMLELEIENLSLELEEEKRKSSGQQAECAKHLQELEDADRELFHCQTALQESEGKLANAQVEIRDKNEELTDAEEELMQCRQRVGELEQQIEHITERNQEEAQINEVKAVKPESELEESRKQCAQQGSLGQQQTPALDQINELLQETLEEQARLMIHTKALEDQVETLRRELQIVQNEAANKTEEMDVLRSYLRGSGQRKSKSERDPRETETEMERNLMIRDSMIGRYTHQIEELQVKARRIPQLASQLSKYESLHATLTSQRAALASDMETSTKAFEQKESEMRCRMLKLESTLSSSEAKNVAMKSAYQKEICDVKASKNALEQEKKKTARRLAELESKNKTLARDVKQREGTQKALEEAKRTLEKRVSDLEKVRAQQRSSLGIVFCVDLSGSLHGNPERLAKDAFRNLINNLCVEVPDAHEVAYIEQAISTVSGETGIDRRVILGMIMQESQGNVCVYTTCSADDVRNAGLMQSHIEVSFDLNNAEQSILQMVRDGVQGTPFGDGLVQALD